MRRCWRRQILLAEVGIEAVKMRKATTGAIILEVPGDKNRKKAFTLATRLAQIRDPATVRVAAPARMAELVGIDISVSKEELQDTLTAGCDGTKVQVGEIGSTRNGLGSAWVHCPVVGARKLAQAGKVALGWSIARVEAMPRGPCNALNVWN